jgi:hypothetical protein
MKVQILSIPCRYDSAARREAGRVTQWRVRYSTAFTISSITFFASPNTIIVLSM